MPLIRIEYDDTKLEEEAVVAVSNAIQKIVSTTTGIEDVFVYANSSRIKIKIAPIEIWVEMSAHKITDIEALLGQFKEKLSSWKTETDFKYPINLTVNYETRQTRIFGLRNSLTLKQSSAQKCGSPRFVFIVS